MRIDGRRAVVQGSSETLCEEEAVQQRKIEPRQEYATSAEVDLLVPHGCSHDKEVASRPALDVAADGNVPAQFDASLATGDATVAPAGAAAYGHHRARSDVPEWPAGFPAHAKLSEAKGWHLLNEISYGFWGVVTAGRAALQIGVEAGKAETLSFTSLLPATNEGALAGGLFSLMEAIGTAHLRWKAGRKKSELVKAMGEHADGRVRFCNDNPRISRLLSERRTVSILLENWPRDNAMNRLPEWQRDVNAPALKLEKCESDLKDVEGKLEELALDLVADFEHYIQYEQAANQLGEATDNVNALGAATARDTVVQLGGTACNAVAAAVKLGANGVNIAANTVAGGAFAIGMGALHVGAGAFGWYQSERCLADLEVARSRKQELRTPEGRQHQVSLAADHHRAWLEEQAAKAVGDAEQQLDAANAVGPALDQEQDIERANQLIDVMMHHRDKGFQDIEEAERLKISRAKVRMGYGGAGILAGTGLIVATVIFAAVPPVAIAAGLLGIVAGGIWLTSGVVRFFKDRRNANRQAESENQAKAAAEAILNANREPTIDEMRNNKFVAIDAMLKALLNADRPVTKQALTETLVGLDMDKSLIDALALRSSVRLDPIYEKDKQKIARNLRCIAEAQQRAGLEQTIGDAALRSDEAMLKSLRGLFQDFIEGKTAMRLARERRVGAFTFLRDRLREKFDKLREKLSFGKAVDPMMVEPPPQANAPAARDGLPAATT